MTNSPDLSIEQIKKLERRAKDLREMLDSVERRWETHYEKVRNTTQWTDYCRETGGVPDYTFSDVLA